MSYNRGSFCHYFVNEEAIEKELKEHNVMHSNALIGIQFIQIAGNH